ncbi:hypothetical protein EDD22DRAFT_964165 [Suillus occidentalis]|nr:hypothetical protein EDD22DRAFT_964165 [Suillus occidentalis]
MSTPVQTSLTGLKAFTVKLVGIIAGARHIPASTGEGHNVLTKQAYTLLGEIIQEHEKGDYIPGILASCSKELMRVHSMTPLVWPNQHSIGHDDPQVSRHTWCNKIRAWEALGDHSCDLPVVPDLSTGSLTVNLSSPVPVPPPAPDLLSAPVLPFPPSIAGTSGTITSEFQDKGKGKAVAINLELEVQGSRKRKSPMISGHSSQPPKSLVIESEDEEDTIVQPISCGVPEVILPQLSTIVVRTPQLPYSPGSSKKQYFGPALMTAGSHSEVTKSPISCPEVMATSGSHLEVVEPTNDTTSTLDGEPPAILTFDITIPSPMTVPSSSFVVPHAVLDVPILDLHSMAITIRDGVARMVRLIPYNTSMRASGARWSTSTLHFHFQTHLPMQHPPLSMSPLPSALPNLINLDMGVMEPTLFKVEDGSDMVGLMFEHNQVQPEGPQLSSEIMDPDDPGNLFPEYNSVSKEVDIEVKAGPSGEEVEMAT